MYNIKMDFKKLGLESMDCIFLGKAAVAYFLNRTTELSGFVKDREYFHETTRQL